MKIYKSNNTLGKSIQSINNFTKLLIFIFIALLFLDSTDFSIITPLGRIRPNIIFILFLGILNIIKFINSKVNKFLFTKSSLLLILYIFINIISFICIGLDSNRLNYGFRILLLLFYWLIVFLFIENIFKNKLHIFYFIKILFIFGFIQGLLGIFQWLVLGIRPTGTISDGSDADYFGILIMWFLIVLIVFRILKVNIISNKFDILLIFIFSFNVYFSFVRSAWIGLIGGFFFISYLSTFKIFGSHHNVQRKLFIYFLFILTIILILFFISPNVQAFAISRISNDTGDQNSIQGNIRLVMMAGSWANALSSPIIGNGPAAFAIQGMQLDIPWAGDFAFDPSIVTTLMNDTGIIGTLSFLLFVIYIIRKPIKTFKKNPENILLKYAIAFSVGVLSLCIAYIPSTALWIPYSWVFFSLPTAITYSAIYNRNKI